MAISPSPSLLLFPNESEESADHAAEDVRQLRYGVLLEEAHDLLPEVQGRDEQERHRDLVTLEFRKRRQDDEREGDAARAEQCRVRHENEMHQSRHDCRDQDHDHGPAAAVPFLNKRTEKQDDHEVPDEVPDVRMPEHVSDHPNVSERIQKR